MLAMRPGIPRGQAWRNANYWLNIADARGYVCFKFSDDQPWAPRDLASLALDGYPSRRARLKGRKAR